jgi:hypothetical protein
VIDVSAPPADVLPELIRGPNWALLSNRRAADGPSLIHADPLRNNEAVAFRGYVLSPPLHSWSPARQLLDYWEGDLERRHNGVFATARIADGGSSLRIATDAFGVAPLYWRQLRGGLVLFSTSLRYLRVAADTLNPYSERLFMHRQALAGDASLLDGVDRVSPGTILSFTVNGMHTRSWFDWNNLPPGDEPISDDHLVDAEATFQTAMDRCSNLMPGVLSHLPLSSGDDSRRILASLNTRGSSFQAMTVRVLQKDSRDLDGRFASEMATRFGFDHEVLDVAEPLQYGRDDAACRLLFSSEVSEHTWIAPLIRALPHGLSLVFDGLAGDIFGNTGFGRKELYSTVGDDDLVEVARLATPDAVSDVLRERVWQPLGEVRHRLATDMAFLPRNANRPDLAFLLIRARRGTGPCLQQLLPPGHVPVYPYLDLDHATATLRVNPLAKLDQTLQARCLARFWPNYFSIPGSRRFPANLPRHSTAPEEARLAARMTCLASEAPFCGAPQALRKIRLRSAAVAALGALSETLTLRVAWWLAPLQVLEAFRSHAAVCEIE